jgi:alkanesulfonate monooxygenase SsuD/methylene tetrahydromethanopterin reductase-like flavin-dependent oxidoreductase (luciferase family)
VAGEVSALAADRGRGDVRFHHGLFVWCGFGPDPAKARTFIAEAMESTYRVPFDSFERYSPFGTPEAVAEQLRPYLESGCSTFHLVPCAETVDAAIEGAAEVRRLLR